MDRYNLLANIATKYIFRICRFERFASVNDGSDIPRFFIGDKADSVLKRPNNFDIKN